MRVLSATLVAAVGLAVLSGCTDRGGTAGGAPTSAPASESPQPVPTGTQLVGFRRTGGIAGVDDTFVVFTDGRYQLTARNQPPRRGQLKPEELAELRKVLSAAKIGAQPQPTSTGAVADAFHYELTVGGRSLRLTDGAVPDAVEPVLSALTALVSQYGQ